MKPVKEIKFVQDAFYNGELAHKAGEVIVLDDSKGYASRWIRRGVAVYLDSVVVDEKKSNKDKSNKNKKSQEKVQDVKEQKVETEIEPEQTENVAQVPESFENIDL